MKRIVLTGFEPFDGLTLNPSQLIAEHLDGAEIHHHRIVGATLACEFGKSLRQLKTLIRQHEPTLVICLGLAGGRTDITPERVAINLDDARIPDNAGNQRSGRPVVRAGPVAYWSTLPIKAIVAELQQQGIPASVSPTAGTFVCNHVFYGLMHELAKHSATIRGGFIHLPFLTGHSAPEPNLDWERMLEGITLAIDTALRIKRDSGQASGTIH